VFESSCNPSTSGNRNATLVRWIIRIQKLQDATGRRSLNSGLGSKEQAGTKFTETAAIDTYFPPSSNCLFALEGATKF